MGDIRNELRLEPLALELLFHRKAHPLPHGVQILRVALKIPVHVLCRDLRFKVTRGKCGAALLQSAQLHRRRAGQQGHKQRNEDRKTHRVAAAQRKHKKPQHEAAQRGLPHKRDAAQDVQQQLTESRKGALAEFQNSPAKLQRIKDQRVAPPCPELDTHAQRHPRRKHKRRAQRDAGKTCKAHRRKIKPRRLHHINAYRTQSRKCHAQKKKIEVKRDLLRP